MFKVKNEVKRERAISLVKEGCSYTKAAKKVEVSCSTVHRWCTSAGVKSSFKQGSPRKYDWDKIAEEYEKGKPTTALANEYGADLKTIQIVISKTRKNRYVYASRVRWRRLLPTSWTKNGHPSTRIVSIPVSILKELGFDGDHEIYGRWNIRGNNLVLELKERRRGRVKDIIYDQ